jgi:glycosyltransferase involved in cell wall biosynthesis
MTSNPEPGASNEPGTTAPRPAGDLILIPVFNDWESLSELLPKLDQSLAGGSGADLLLVDDGSTVEPPPSFGAGPFRAIRRVDLLRLRRNLGHQRAIAVGLAYAEDRLDHDAVVVMDGDGEDDPADVPRLLERLRAEGGARIVFAERARRSENLTFRFFYALYKSLHRAMTGQGVRVGNFSAIPRKRLSSLVVVSELWNHYAASAFRSRQPLCTIPTRRARRLRGRSSMNFASLVVHGLSAIAVYSDLVGVRLLVLAFLLGLMGAIGLVATVMIRLLTPWAIPGWATASAGISLLLIVQSIMLSFVLSLVILGSRQGTSFIPRRDYAYFIDSTHPLAPPP